QTRCCPGPCSRAGRGVSGGRSGWHRGRLAGPAAAAGRLGSLPIATARAPRCVGAVFAPPILDPRPILEPRRATPFRALAVLRTDRTTSFPRELGLSQRQLIIVTSDTLTGAGGSR